MTFFFSFFFSNSSSSSTPSTIIVSESAEASSPAAIASVFICAFSTSLSSLLPSDASVSPSVRPAFQINQLAIQPRKVIVQ
eukprot:CAMPEP_0172562288 /NCGR_PEP_ID=MMETSP1067-20121228/96373_1 /TAXON_ID=265564 ORGANISM="Thalassiosira punctigera, Strain Tpunct2005C2" /NCGR_SAMPLE_ID=MMETSP1067 /ASSEMBLY_ACC=CAM_ASM_000444 /LENGTH=80 /DNA_ID=CAMNT_0013352489 /DNA_START=76 /DNA_END=315 /DNA_ORIENTATION=-